MPFKDAAREFARNYAPGLLRSARLVRAFLWNSFARMEVTFESIYRRNGWGSAESRSGPGSTLVGTCELREQLPSLISELEVRALVDAPCGDYWIRWIKLDLESYIGIDVVQQLIDSNNHLYGSSRHRFVKLDLARQAPPKADLILCRDLFIHLSYRHAFEVFRNFKR